MYKINVIKNNKIVQVINTYKSISYVLTQIHSENRTKNINLEQTSLFEYNLIII